MFLFAERRTIPSKYIAFCPLIAFVLATVPALFRQLNYNECGHYCWFEPAPRQPDCRVRSLWAWLCYYAWMILILTILLGSTLAVLGKIAMSVMHARWDLKQFSNQPFSPAAGDATSQVTTLSTVGTLRTLSQHLQSRITSALSSASQQRVSSKSGSQQEDSQVSKGSGTTASTMVDCGLPTLDNEAIHTSGSSDIHPQTLANPQPVRITQPTSNTQRMGGTSASRTNERSFLVAILRQAFYPISISVCGCIQIIVDVTMVNIWDYQSSVEYAANIATSVQGFLFFLVFMFDPAVIQTRRQWRKYMIWKYYIEFYYSLGMPQEGREFEDRFMERCQVLNRPGNEATFDLLAKPPSYSWSLQYDDLAMPSDFQTAYPLTNVRPALNTEPYTQSPSTLHNPDSLLTSHSALEQTSNATGIKRAEYTPSFPNPSSDTTRQHHDKQDMSIYPTMTTDTPSKVVVGESASMAIPSLHPAELEAEQGTSKELMDKSDVSEVDQITSQSSRTRQPSTITAYTHEDNASHILPAFQTRSHDDGNAPRRSRRPSRQKRDWLDLSDSELDDIGPLDSESDDDMDLERAPRRKITLTASQPGDVLSFTKLSRVATIGGSNNMRRFRPMPERTSNSSAGLSTLVPSSIDSSGSLRSRLRLLVKPSRRDRDPIMYEYQTQFRHPKCAYIMHQIVRLVYIPREARLPPILNPFKKRYKPDVSTGRTSERGSGQQTLSREQAMMGPEGEPGEESSRAARRYS